MTTLTVDGVYEDGKVQLSTVPTGVEKARVRVTFLLGDEAERARREAAERFFRRMEKGIDLGGSYIARDEVYEDFRG